MKLKNLLILLSLIFFGILSGCIADDDIKDKDDNDVEVVVEKDSKVLLENTPYETEVYYYKTNIEGPKVLIVGGIHGDELAGWHTATQMLEYDFTFGTVIILPRANKLATVLEKRFPGQGNKGEYNGLIYSDINRTFPGKADGTETEKISYAISTLIDEENPDYVLDLHESIRNYVDGNLGNSVIYGNIKSALFAIELVEAFNAVYETPNGVEFTFLSNPPKGSINDYCSQTAERVVFTFETDRRLDLEERINQQMILIEEFFQMIKQK